VINNGPRLVSDTFANQIAELTQDILKEIVARFETARNISRHYKARLEEEIRGVRTREKGPQFCLMTLHNRVLALTTGRWNQIGLFKKSAWAL
jgi:hypothetical protein